MAYACGASACNGSCSGNPDCASGYGCDMGDLHQRPDLRGTTVPSSKRIALIPTSNTIRRTSAFTRVQATSRARG